MYSQTTTSKSCGKCGSKVSIYSKVGDTCPYCGVKWGRENTSSTRTYTYPTASKIDYSMFELPQIPTTTQPTTETRRVDKSTASKAETEKWILSKLKAYTKGDKYRKNYFFNFDKHYLIIDYIENYKLHKYKIPIYDIDYIYLSGSKLKIYTKESTIMNIPPNTPKYISSEAVVRGFIGGSSETNMKQRLDNAFFHLKKFYKKPKSTEPF